MAPVNEESEPRWLRCRRRLRLLTQRFAPDDALQHRDSVHMHTLTHKSLNARSLSHTLVCVCVCVRLLLAQVDERGWPPFPRVRRCSCRLQSLMHFHLPCIRMMPCVFFSFYVSSRFFTPKSKDRFLLISRPKFNSGLRCDSGERRMQCTFQARFSFRLSLSSSPSVEGEDADSRARRCLSVCPT